MQNKETSTPNLGIIQLMLTENFNDENEGYPRMRGLACGSNRIAVSIILSISVVEENNYSIKFLGMEHSANNFTFCFAFITFLS